MATVHDVDAAIVFCCPAIFLQRVIWAIMNTGVSLLSRVSFEAGLPSSRQEQQAFSEVNSPDESGQGWTHKRKK